MAFRELSQYNFPPLVLLTTSLIVLDRDVFVLVLPLKRLAGICPVVHGYTQTSWRSTSCSNNSRSPTKRNKKKRPKIRRKQKTTMKKLH